MGRISGLSPTGSPPLRLVSVDDESTGASGSASREERLAQILNQRLEKQLSRIRENLDASPAPSAPATGPNPSGTGQRLDILA